MTRTVLSIMEHMVMSMDNDEFLKNVNESDIPETYQPVVSLIGLDNFLKLCQYAMGDELYFPMQKSILSGTRNRLILQEYNGYNLMELSKKYNLTTKQIKNIINASNRPDLQST